ncbi:MAG: sugar transferase [Armatimonadetes bacterium]|nr:sugar transferase [Armatimonadota bacterium]
MAERAVRRLADVALSCGGLLLLGPVLIALSVWVWLDAGWPVLYRGVRTGRHGVPFRIYKFRTMVPDAETRGGGTTGQNDPRVTRSGRFLRRHKLDELPQLLNVIRGDMSLVGPRPELLRYTTLYSAEEREILGVRPGITDPSSLEFIALDQVVGSDSPDATYERTVLPVKNRLRLEYVRTRTLWRDFGILAKTAWRVARRLAARP